MVAFSVVINFLSILPAEAVPKKILDVMDVGGLTRENVASHLQVLLLWRNDSCIILFDFFCEEFGKENLEL